ncbi:hypothetical protein KTS45_03730 [Halomicroarcula limicola]|uniref:Uncharacterized protein n=1 Tax=Haloarcula limicola TaxID=1429915 RepID=A0A8J7Y2T9_9EURY|nr:hypothetical protein [Halomicroarcula limicola]MBV0923300.1 hypothetical protein [Halomicroarcula limicola]
MSGLDGRPVRSTAALSGTLAVAVALLVGLGVGDPLTVLVSVGGALSLAGGIWALDGGSNARVAGGSVALLVGTLCLGATLTLGASTPALFVTLGLGLAVTLVVTDATTGLARSDSLGTALRESGNALLVGIVLAVLLNLLVEFDPLTAVAAAVLALAVSSSLVAFVTLQLAVLGVLALLDRTVPIVDGWLPDRPDSEGPLDGLADAGVAATDVPKTVWAVLGVELFVALTPFGRALFALFLDGVPLVGPVLEFALSGVLHVAVGLVAVALVGVVAADGLRHWVADWLGDDPARTLSLQAGGLLTVALALVGTAALSVLGRPLLPGPDGGVTTVVGPAAVVLGAVVSLLLVTGIALQAVALLPDTGFVAPTSVGFTVGSALLFLSTLGAAELGLWTPLVVVGVAGALLVWDTGVHASGLGAQLGRAAESTDSQYVHVTGSAAVLATAVVVALAARYLLVPALAPPASPEAAWRSAVALGLVLVALVAFGLALTVREKRSVAE